MSRPDGPFDYYADLYGGGANVTAASIRALVDDPATDSATIGQFADDLHHDSTVTATLLEGQIRDDVTRAPTAVGKQARRLSTNATYAVGLVNLMAAHVHAFDTKVADLNARYRKTLHACRVVAGVAPGNADDLQTAPLVAGTYVSPPTAPTGAGNAWQQAYAAPTPGPTFDAHSVGAAIKADLQGEYNHAKTRLNNGTDHIVTMFRQGATHGNLHALVDAGAIPLTVAATWPWLDLTPAEERKALEAMVASGAIPNFATLPGGSVQRWLKQHPEIANYLSLFTPVGLPYDGDPTTVAKWWHGLGVLGQLAEATQCPEVVGNLDGVQAWGRDLANRTQLDAWIRDIKAGNVPPGMTDDAVSSLLAIEKVLGQHGPRQLLGLDPYSGERTHAIVAIGNVDTADNVGVFTPGLKTTVPDKLASYDADMANLYAQAKTMITNHDSDATVATVSYLGYDAPQWNASVLDFGIFGGQADSVASGDLAQKGGDSLSDFYKGLNASRPDNFHLTAIGHSYGSTTTGYALQHRGVDVDDAVLFGCPGLGTSNRDDLDAGNVYLVENDNDIVADLGAFGGDPSFIDGVTHLQSHAASLNGEDYQGSTGHGSYLDDGTTAQHNVAAVLTGYPDEQIRGNDLDHGDLLKAPTPGDIADAAGATAGEIKDGFTSWSSNLIHGLETFGRPPGY